MNGYRVEATRRAVSSSLVLGLFSGAGYMARGIRWTAANPRWWFFGLIPALIAFVLYVVALVFLARSAGDLASAFTPFAESWSWRDGFRTAVAVLIFAGGVALAIITFTALTLTVGGPFYEKLSSVVEDQHGGAPQGAELSWWRQIVVSTRESVTTLLVVLAFTVPLFFLGFIPIVGQTVVPVIGALVSGYFLTMELSALPLERRGLSRKERAARLRANRGAAIGFGVLVFVIFLIPLGAVLAMPGAVAGATLLTRERLAPA